MKQAWWKEAVVYQIYPRSFLDTNGDGIGDLPGIIAKLDYLQELGVDAIWICPIYKSPNDDNGYDVSDYQDIMDEFGTMEDFDALLEAAHQRGIKVIMDLILNHTSDEHPWFIESRSSKDSPKRDYYIWRDGRDGKEPNNWESIFSGSAWQFDAKTEQYYLHLFSKKQPDLNMENPVVRDELVQMILWWLEKGIDGFRIDAISHIKKAPGLPDMPNPQGLRYVEAFPMHRNVEGLIDFVQEFKDRAFSKYDIMTVGEANGVPVEQAEQFVGEERGAFNMLFHFEHMDLDFGPEGRWDSAPMKLADLKRVMTKWQKGLQDKGWNALYLENHDQPRSVSRFGDSEQYLAESAKMLATFYLLLQGTPYIYQGQELGMTNISFDSIDQYRDVESLNYYRERNIDGHDVQDTMRRIHYRSRDNSRTPMQWTDGPNAGFTTGTPWIEVNPNYRTINVERQLREQDSVFHYYKRLIQLRKANQALIYGDYDLLLEDHEQLYVYTRTMGAEKWAVVCNFSAAEVAVTLPFATDRLMLGNYAEESNILRPYEARVYKVADAEAV